MSEKDRGYIYCDDLLVDGTYREYTLTIIEVFDKGTITNCKKEVIDKYVLAFDQTDKRLVLADVNRRLVQCQFGKKVANWINKTITLYPVKGNWFGQRDVTAIRIRVPEGIPRPLIQRETLGTDITGIVITEPTDTKPKKPKRIRNGNG